MGQSTTRKFTAALVAASLTLAIGAGSASAAKPDGLPGGPPSGLPGVPELPPQAGNGKGKGKGKTNAARACKAERGDIGADAFRERYGTNKNGRNAFGKCVAGKRKGGDSGETGEGTEPIAS